jgi:hypothetical protein
LALIKGSFADVTELIMFNPPTGVGAGHLSRRVNFAVPDNFTVVYRRGSPHTPGNQPDGWSRPDASNQSSTAVNVARTWIFALNKR